MLVIKDASGEIIAAQVEESPRSEIATYILPADPQHTLHRVSDVPAEICDLADPVEFHRVITYHVNSELAKVAQTNAAELQAVYYRILASRDESAQ
ncbi:hypothetical protein [Actinoplanes sp. NBRC 103695]|uniref:hypothetical protein n=1 Tax=Actinoplanes sp. NBRC 103695 TaxID=3032202 RepID=UPI0024A4EC54|nr:hypothetical protein [Actinoplanes sp. NBRC 103695]GLY98367.1 hypothetical protein Acsp02_56210 [Actinoplanes sp. NBRC 103695]